LPLQRRSENWQRNLDRLKYNAVSRGRGDCHEEGGAAGAGSYRSACGDVYRAADRGELAEDCYREALALYRGHGSPPVLDLENATRPLAIVEQDAGKAQETRELWSEARNFTRRHRCRRAVEECSRRLAHLGGE